MVRKLSLLKRPRALPKGSWPLLLFQEESGWVSSRLPDAKAPQSFLWLLAFFHLRKSGRHSSECGPVLSKSAGPETCAVRRSQPQAGRPQRRTDTLALRVGQTVVRKLHELHPPMPRTPTCDPGGKRAEPFRLPVSFLYLVLNLVAQDGALRLAVERSNTGRAPSTLAQRDTGCPTFGGVPHPPGSHQG